MKADNLIAVSPQPLRFLCALGTVILGIVVFGATMLGATDYYVAIGHPNSSDLNSGLTLDRPFKTLNHAVTFLSPGDTLSIKEGIYREALRLGIDGTSNDPIVVQAYPGDEGKVVIRGSDVVTGWSHNGGGIWSVGWQPLPLIDYPESFPDYGEYSQRREMVFIDGIPLKQVLSRTELVSGHFWMDDVAQRIHIHYPADPNSALVEIAARTEGVRARGRSYQVLRGLRVEHVTSDLTIAAMALGSHQQVIDCRVEYNNGIGIRANTETTVLRSSSSHNGRAGIILSGNNSMLESSETSYNSWRYGPRWDAGGIKIVGGMPSGNRIKQHTANHNNGRGIWFDTANSGNIVEASVIEGNMIGGVVYEAVIGPSWAINNIIVGTILANDGETPKFDGAGISLLATSDTFIYNNTIVDVGGAGILIGGADRDDHRFKGVNTSVFNNIIVNSGVSAIRFHVWGIGASEDRLSSHRFDNNLYFQAKPTVIFNGAANTWSLAEWQDNRGQDLDSLFAPPVFTNPVSGDYSLQVGSPAIDAGVIFPEVSEDFLGSPRPQGSQSDIGAFESLASGVHLRNAPGRRLVP